VKQIELIKRSDGTFCPAHNSDWELTKKVKDGESITAKLSFPRSLKFHKKFFALIRYTHFHMSEAMVEKYPSEDALRLELTLQAGYWEKHYTIGGKEVIYPKSISFEKMDNEEFARLYSAVLDVVLKWFIDEIDENELLNFM
jgi:hypothetical protein